MHSLANHRAAPNSATPISGFASIAQNIDTLKA